MTDKELQIKVAIILGYTPYYSKGENWDENPEFYSPDGKFCILEDIPNYPTDLNACRVMEEKILKSSRPYMSDCEHEPWVYIRILSKILGIKTREELVISVDDDERHLVKNLPKPITLPPSAIVLTHGVSPNGYELQLARVTARQRCEAFVETIEHMNNLNKKKI